MSTRITTSSHGYDLADSASLALIQAIGGFQARILEWLVKELWKEGFSELTPTMLTFLGALDCGTNHASALARDLNVSRQAIHKQVRELEKLGWLATEPHPDKGNQRVIVFTAEGERMMSAARALFADLDHRLSVALPADIADLGRHLSAFKP